MDLLLVSYRHGFSCKPEQRNSAGLSAPRPGSGDVQGLGLSFSRATALEPLKKKGVLFPHQASHVISQGDSSGDAKIDKGVRVLLKT